MAQRSKLKRRSDDLVRYKGPTAAVDNEILDQAYLTANGGDAILRVFDHEKDHVIAQPLTRLKSAVLAGGTTWIVPHFAPAWLESGDTVAVYIGGGIDEGTRWEQHVVTTVTAGTNQDTAGTNFHSLAMATGVTEALPAGTPLRLVTKAAGSTQLPVETREFRIDARPFDAGDQIELDATTAAEVLTMSGGPATVYASQDGAEALDQPWVGTVIVTGATAGAVHPGARVRRKIQTDITMAEYGDPSTLAAWTALPNGGGFGGNVPDTWVEVRTGMVLELETNFDGGSADLVDIRSLLADVIEDRT
tara:strand:- start:3385 stop:4299 length:915 start_codon:yes stop_codon:yes gene_type:complete